MPATRATLRVTLACNNRCRFCAQRGVEAGPEPSAAQLLAKVVDSSGAELTLCGGEPTLHPALTAVVAGARQQGFRRIGLQSNGRDLARDDLAARLADAGLTDLHLSIQGASAAVHDYHTGVPGSHAAALAALAASRAAGLTVVVTTLLCRSNFRVLSELPGLLRDRGVAAWQLALPRAHGAAAADFDQLIPRLGLALPFALHALEVARELGLPRWLRGAPLCTLGRFASAVIADQPRAYAAICSSCAGRDGCDGVDATYLRRFDGDELSPLDSAPPGRPAPGELERMFVAIGELGPAPDAAATPPSPRRRRAHLDRLSKPRPAAADEAGS